MKVDFHCHTRISDGSLSPEAVIDLALEHQVDWLAITDHDTTLSYELVKDYAQSRGLKLTSGTEISCAWQGHTIHIVGLNVDVAHSALQAGLKFNRVLRWQRAFAIAEKLSQKNIHNVLQDVLAQVDVGMVGRNHFAQVLIARKLVKDQQQAFDRYLKKGRPAFVAVNWPSLETVVNWIVGAGGVAVIAHPNQYAFTRTKLNRMIDAFKQAGGRGIEVVNQPRVNSDQQGMAERAARFDLLASMGSDFHRPEQSWRGLGWLAPLPKNCQPIWEVLA